MNRKILSLAIALTTILFASCSNHSMDTAKELSKSYTYDGKTIELEGLLSTGGFVWANENRKTMDLMMTCGTALDNTKHEIVNNITVNYGTGPNSVIINVPADAKEFKDTDVALYDKDGKKLSVSDKVKISGTVTYTAKGPKKETKGFKVNMPKINKDDEDKDDGNDYSYTITNVVIEKI